MTKFFKGKCRRCGQCCKGISVSEKTGKLILKWKQYLKKAPDYKPKEKSRINIVFLAKNWIKISFKEAKILNPSLSNTDGRSYYKCNGLVNNKCILHKERPDVCKNYPNYPYRTIPIGLLNENNCGYVLKGGKWNDPSNELPAKSNKSIEIWLSKKNNVFKGFYYNDTFTDANGKTIIDVHWYKYK